MKQNFGLIGLSVGGLILAISLSGCTGNGPQFTSVQQPKHGKGILYVYRPSSLMGAGMHYDVKVNSHVIGSMDNGEYMSKELSHGQKVVSATTESTTTLPVNIQKGKMTCVRAGIGFGVLVGRPTLEHVDNNTCLKEIKDTVKSID
jgi:hypothetical protein